jgi:hypothetical protein
MKPLLLPAFNKNQPGAAALVSEINVKNMTEREIKKFIYL